MLLLRLIIPLIFLVGSVAYAEEGYFSSSSENGLTGIFETPTARIMNENEFRMGLFQTYPYRNYALAVSFYDRLEISGRLTEVLDTDRNDSDYWADYGNYKDKFIAGKFKLLEESKYLPQVAVGLNDPHGTKLFGAQYFVMSKQIYPFDFSFGVGLGRYGDVPFNKYSKKDILKNFVNPKEYIKEGNPFFSINFRPSERFSLLYEYNPINYLKQYNDPAVVYDVIEQSSHHSFGGRYYFSENLYLTTSYQRGERYGIGLTMPFTIGEPVIPIYVKEPYVDEKITNANPDVGLKLGMVVNGFGPAGSVVIGNTAYIEMSNNIFFFEEDGVRQAVKILSMYDYDGIEDYVVVVKDKNVSVYCFTVSADALDLYKEGRLNIDELMEQVSVNRDYIDVNIDNRTAGISYYYGFKPQFNFYLNDPSGFFKGSAGLRGWAGKYIYENLSIVGGGAFYPINTVSTVNEPLSVPVRSDITEYIDKKYLLENLELDYIKRIPDTDLYFNSELGILETQYAGLNLDLGTHFIKDRLLMAVSTHIVKKRDKDKEFEISKDSEVYKTYFLKTRINSKRLGGYMEIHAGRFLAGDHGAKIILTKNIKGVLLTAWYTETDTSVFSDSYNKGYSDKGIMVTVPFRLFTGKDSKSAYSQSISPWTRDVGAQVGEFTNILDFIGKSPYELR